MASRWLREFEAEQERDLAPNHEQSAPAPTVPIVSIVTGIDSENAIAAETEERAAIAQFDAGYPKDWAEGFARLSTMPRPDVIPAAMWGRMVDTVGMLLDRWGAELVANGWQALDLFAVDPRSPVFRTSTAGLVRTLADGRARVESIEADAIVLRVPGGAVQRFYRSAECGGVPLWEFSQ